MYAWFHLARYLYHLVRFYRSHWRCLILFLLGAFYKPYTICRLYCDLFAVNVTTFSSLGVCIVTGLIPVYIMHQANYYVSCSKNAAKLLRPIIKFCRAIAMTSSPKRVRVLTSRSLSLYSQY